MDIAFDILLIEGGAGREPDKHILGSLTTVYIGLKYITSLCVDS